MRYVEQVHYYNGVDAGKCFEIGSSRNQYEPFCSVDRPLLFLRTGSDHVHHSLRTVTQNLFLTAL